ncbi:MAG: M67 family metallopeptidase [Candidatus Korarchaeum sp.]|nr:M67 family metallopeptidase [Candidatus Korarchaeum sp.]
MGPLRVEIPRHIIEEILRHAMEEMPREACGLLIGYIEGSRVVVRGVHRARNMSESHSLYEVDPQDIYRAMKEAESSGLELIGVYHSHPIGTPTPSKIDEERAIPGLIYLIVSGSGDFKAFKLARGRFEELEISDTPPEGLH